MACGANSGHMTTYSVKPLATVDTLLRSRKLWRGQIESQDGSRITGHEALDRALPGRGWPEGALIEILHAQAGIGEVELILPTLAQLTQDGQRIALIQTPYLPQVVSLAARGVDLRHLIWVETPIAKQAWWATEQILRSGACGAVALWGEPADDSTLRRLQLAAEEGNALAFLYRSEKSTTRASPAALRLKLHRISNQLQIELLKVRGGHNGLRLTLGSRI